MKIMKYIMKVWFFVGEGFLVLFRFIVKDVVKKSGYEGLVRNV